LYKKDSTKKGSPDGDYGDETLKTVQQFQSKNGLTVDGKIGRETLRSLDKESSNCGSTPPQPSPPTNTDQQIINAANTARTSALSFAATSLTGLELALADGLGSNEIRRFFSPTVVAVERWLKIRPEDPNYLKIIQDAHRLIARNLGTSATLRRQKVDGPPSPNNKIECADPRPAFAWSYISRPDLGVSLCDSFISAGQNCQRDGLTHEHFHLIGLHGEITDRSSVTNPAQAMDNADSVASLVSELSTGDFDSCQRK
jgi:Putative peptidoglycan binding domain